jgi:hypothetical protein
VMARAVLERLLDAHALMPCLPALPSNRIPASYCLPLWCS